MNEISWRARVREWFMSHTLWEAAMKYIFTPAFAWIVSLGISRMMAHATLGTAFNIFLVLIGGIGILWMLGAVQLPAFGKKEEPKWEIFFFSPGLAASLTPSIGRVVISLNFFSTNATEMVFLHVTLRTTKERTLTVNSVSRSL